MVMIDSPGCGTHHWITARGQSFEFSSVLTIETVPEMVEGRSEPNAYSLECINDRDSEMPPH